MALNGQASGDWLESSSALRILYAGKRNSLGVLTDDSFTQTNPPIVTVAASISTNVDTSVLGVLGGSVAFTRPDQGSNYVGGPTETGSALVLENIRPLGLFINDANGRAFENQPGAASGKGPYMSSQGSYASQLFETQALAAGTTIAANADLTYLTGQALMASRNGYLMPTFDGGVASDDLRNANISAEMATGTAAAAADVTIIGVLKMPADSAQPEIVFDQRI